MRPKRHILLADPNEGRQAITRFVLEQHRYTVLSASSLYEASEVGHSDPAGVDLVIAFAPLDKAYLEDVAASLGCPSLYIGQRGVFWPSMEEVLELVRIRCRKKSGPPKGHRKEVASVPVENESAVLEATR